MNKNVVKKRALSTNPLLITDKNEQIRQYNRGELSEVYNDKEKEQAQNAIRLLVQNANDQVSKMNIVILFYLIDINVMLAI